VNGSQTRDMSRQPDFPGGSRGTGARRVETDMRVKRNQEDI
jgi:hypothetical protein